MHSIGEMTEDQLAIQDAVEKTVSQFGEDYWAKTDETGDWPEAFCDEMAKGGWLGVAFPEEYGGAGLDTILVTEQTFVETLTTLNTIWHEYEHIDLSDGLGFDFLFINALSEIADASSTIDTLAISGDAGDTVIANGLGLTAGLSGVELFGDGRLYDSYAAGSVMVWIEDEVGAVV